MTKQIKASKPGEPRKNLPLIKRVEVYSWVKDNMDGSNLSDREAAEMLTEKLGCNVKMSLVHAARGHYGISPQKVPQRATPGTKKPKKPGLTKSTKSLIADEVRTVMKTFVPDYRSLAQQVDAVSIINKNLWSQIDRLRARIDAIEPVIAELGPVKEAA